jgi:copper homeostasis protein (lipoprotein)
MTRLAMSFLVVGAALSGGCDREYVERVQARTPMPVTLAGVYAGELPCSNCASIEATLWLRPDAAFVLRQQLVDDPDEPSADAKRAPSLTYGLGRWSFDEVSAEVVLRGRGPERRLVVHGDDRLRLLVASGNEHVLVRDPLAPPFADRLVLDGESAVTAAGATFKECATGLTFVVADAGAYRELRRQHGRMNARGKVALTTIEGHLILAGKDATTSEKLVVDKFITIKPGIGC